MTNNSISDFILGIQARREDDGRTSFRLPTYKDAKGAWLPAIRLPEETHAPLADAVLTFLLEKGLARRKFELQLASKDQQTGFCCKAPLVSY